MCVCVGYPAGKDTQQAAAKCQNGATIINGNGNNHKSVVLILRKLNMFFVCSASPEFLFLSRFSFVCLISLIFKFIAHFSPSLFLALYLSLSLILPLFSRQRIAFWLLGILSEAYFPIEMLRSFYEL